MTNDSKNQETEGNNATQVATGRWRSDIFGHETGDQIRIGLEKIIADLPEPTVMTEWMLQETEMTSLPAWTSATSSVVESRRWRRAGTTA